MPTSRFFKIILTWFESKSIVNPLRDGGMIFIPFTIISNLSNGIHNFFFYNTSKQRHTYFPFKLFIHSGAIRSFQQNYFTPECVNKNYFEFVYILASFASFSI